MGKPNENGARIFDTPQSDGQYIAGIPASPGGPYGPSSPYAPV